jgi:non-ribosomal peptide synthetase component F
MLSHRAAFCFLDWCESAFHLQQTDRFSSHAPFHFDLSVFDLYASCRHAATLVLINESLARDPARLGPFLHQERISVWYSAPSILALMVDHGGLDQPGRHAPRLALFAGEVFPQRPLQILRALWPHTELWNLYGPTETNVCTAYRLPAELHDRPLPIGHVCPPLEARVVDAFGRDLPPGSRGELLIRGPGVMLGYFGRPDLTAHAFLRDAGGAGSAWYRTGDLVTDAGSGLFTFHGRRDRMVKKRGFRIELGEIEAALQEHPDVLRAAAIPLESDDGLQILAFVSLHAGRSASLISLKRHCASRIPNYMIPDRISFLPALPMTSTNKIDYPALIHMAHLHTPGRSSPHAPAA